MKIIAHRANLAGPEPWKENTPVAIDLCIDLGFDVEIDLRYSPMTRSFVLGHDKGEHPVTLDWLDERKESLWVHCKDLFSLNKMTEQSGFRYFWHQEDDYTLTSNEIIWAYPGKEYTCRTVIVMPEWDENVDWDKLKKSNCYGVCTDYPEKLR